MHHFRFINNELHCENVPVRSICSDVGTPTFIYSRQTLERHFGIFDASFESVNHIICFSVKACSNLAILKLFADMGSGADIVSGGELYRALKAGIDPGKIVYSGVGKRSFEIDEALRAGILMFNVESEGELELLSARAAELGIEARVALRVNPDVDPKTHPKISTGLKKNKFGIEIEKALELYERSKGMTGIRAVGVDCHIGSQLTAIEPFEAAVDKLCHIIDKINDMGIDIRYVDVGGGLGIPYDDEDPPSPTDYGKAVIQRLQEKGVTLIMEPGRVIAGNAGILVTEVLFHKKTSEKNFVIVDAAMNDLMRPTLYEAYHSITRVNGPESTGTSDGVETDVVGPICETGDYLARGRLLDTDISSGELLAVMSAGAYGFSMSSNYNSRPRGAEVLVDKDRFFVIRERETYEDLIRGERMPPGL